MYRSRLGNKLDEIILDYVSSISDDNEIVFYDIVGSQAHSIMLYENKINADKIILLIKLIILKFRLDNSLCFLKCFIKLEKK